MADFKKTPRTKVRRLPERGHYDRGSIYRILDEGLICHIGFVVDGQPYVIPTGYVRVGDKIYIHGSPVSRMMNVLENGIELCLTVTLLDGLVLARSAYHHSMNYRSVMVFGHAVVVDPPEEREAALRSLVEHVIPGRWKDVRPPNEIEMKATRVLAISLREASAKIRVGPPQDDAADYGLPVWAGEIPLRLVAGAPRSDPQLSGGISVPRYAEAYTRKTKKT